jgi:hypothetical protein
MKIPEIILIEETKNKYGYDVNKFTYKDHKKKVIRKCFVCGEIYEQTFNSALNSFRKKSCKFCAYKNHSVIMSDKVKKGEFIPPMLGKTHTEEVKEKARKRLIGKTFEDLFGKEKSDEIKRKASIKNSGENNPFFGKTHTEETKEKLRIWNKINGRKGKYHNFYGKNYNTISSTEEFIEKSKKMHGDLYDYSISNYIGRDKPIDIICKKHGKFTQIAATHYNSGCGCTICSNSKGELKIYNFLVNNKIKFQPEYRFENCKNKKTLPFDFYLEDINTCIEYDGELHFMDKFGSLEQQIINDEIKTNFCKNNQIKLIRIPYTEFNNIEKILNENL